MIQKLKWFNIALRAVMELGIVLGLGYWGFKTGSGTAMKFVIGIGAPLIGFGFWGLADFRRTGSNPEVLRLMQELTISGLAAAGLYSVGEHILGLLLAFISIIHHTLIYMLRETLIKP